MEESEFKRPRTVDTEEYVKARIDQIAELLDVVDNPALRLGEVTSGPRTVFQRLPRHLRRRAMSHNVKRLPRALRPIAARHTARTLHRKKAPSRKWRRRPSRMLKLMLEAHSTEVGLAGNAHLACQALSHAVRGSLWGYKLPLRSCQRGYRPNYRCSVRGAVIIDQSYLCCLQFVVNPTSDTFTNNVQTLMDTLSQFCHKRVSPTFANAGAISGQAEVPLMVFSPGKFPNGFIGPARCSWTPDRSLLNLWIHPSMETEMMAELVKLPNISIVPPHEMKRVPTKTDDDEPIKLFILRNRLCRFRLVGSKAITYLRKVLQLVSDEELASSSTEFQQFRSVHRWWHKLGPNLVPGNATDGQVIPLLVEDPRLYRAQPNPECSIDPSSARIPLPQMPNSTSSALFWDWHFYEKQLFPRRFSHAELERACAGKLALPRRTDFKIPILLILRRPSAFARPDPLCGSTVNCVDFVCPSGVGYDFWLALQFANCRAIGLHDKHSLDFEAGIGTFPSDFPDCAAGKAHSLSETKSLIEKNERKPRNRRIAFGRALKMEHPFSFEWKSLLTNNGRESNTSSDQFFVLRDRLLLRRLELWMRDGGTLPHEFLDGSQTALVPISLKMLHRGVPKRLALICRPTDQDMERLKKEGGRVIIKEEPDREEEATTAKKQQNRENEVSSEKAAFSRDLPEFISLVELEQNAYFPVAGSSVEGNLVSLNALFPETPDKDQLRKARNVRKRRAKRAKVIAKKTAKKSEMKEEATKRPVKTVERKLIGRVMRGDYAFTKAQGMALGFIALEGLKTVARTRTVLVRNTTSKYYHPALLHIHSTLPDL